MATTAEQTIPGVIELTPEEARAHFDAQAQKLAGMSGEEFLRRLDAGEFDDVYDDPDYRYVGHLEMIRSFAE